MKQSTQRLITALLALPLAGTAAHAQFYKSFGKSFDRLKGGSVSVGATGQFTTPLTSSPSSGTFAIPSTAGGVLTETVSNQQQYTTDSAGLLVSFQFHPVAWAGVEVNYGYTKYSERYAFNYSGTTALQQVNVPVTTNELTAAYQFHPPHIKFQPFVNIGGGSIQFLPRFNSDQWRAAGLVEAGFDIPTHVKHLALRAQGRTLIYRAPNFYNPAISTRSWRSTEEPSASLVYRF